MDTPEDRLTLLERAQLLHDATLRRHGEILDRHEDALARHADHMAHLKFSWSNSSRTRPRSGRLPSG
jgi:hypothetical protein